mmetsp:Transcript_8928/g.19450  ORF Transcript_8928/g.19450 Transcript_8928/m.19450 type:complete len:274 (-) Transcript_8928:959-1780(-)
MISTSSGMSVSSSSGMFFLNGSRARCASSPILPPTKMLQPGTAFFLPVSGSNFLAGAPMMPMSAAWACPHEFGHPVKWIRSGRGTSKSSSSLRVSMSAFALVSMSARPQNCEPVHETVLPRMLPGVTDKCLPSASAGSAYRASSFDSCTLGRITFCSTVSRTSPAEYLSARSASSLQLSGCRRPVGTCTPTRYMPSCFCWCTPSSSRRVKGVESAGCATSVVTPRSYESISATNCSRNSGKPLASISHISRAFCRSPRKPSSRKMRSTASERA